MFDRSNPYRRATSGACLLAFLLLASGAAIADDRDLLGVTGGDPYVFVLFDTSGSMSRTAPCSRERAVSDDDPFDVMCTSICPFEDPPLVGSSPTCARICPNEGCAEYDFSSTPEPTLVPTIIRDDTDGVQGGGGGAWSEGTTYTNFSGAKYYHDNNVRCGESFGPTTDFSGCKDIVFDPGIAAGDEGDYMVFLWWPDDPNGKKLASNTLIQIEHDGGIAELTVDQRSEGGQWNPIGTWNMGAGDGKVTISNESAQKFGFGFFDKGYAIADAVGWRKVTIPACVGAEVYRCQQPVCPLGDCYAPLNSDDPTSKFFQAKEGLYEVIDQIPDAQFGFATFEQDQLRLEWKHWLYKVADPNPDIPVLKQTAAAARSTGAAFLEIGVNEVFGIAASDGWACSTGGVGLDGSVACAGANPADLSDIWDIERARRVPKLGKGGGEMTEVWYRYFPDLDDRTQDEIYKVVYNEGLGATSLGMSLVAVDIKVYRCDGGVCPAGPLTPVDSGTVNYQLVSEFAAFDGIQRRQPMTRGGFFSNVFNLEVLDTSAETCEGLDGNTDAAADEYLGYSLRWDTTADMRGDDFSPRVGLFDVGDFVPFDWETSARHRDTILERLAPNTVSGGSPPDFRSSVYFANGIDPLDNDSEALRKIRLLDLNERPMMAQGRTPLAASMNELRDWYDPVVVYDSMDSSTAGWRDIAAVEDLQFQCRDKYLLLLTDGTEECSGDAGSAAGDLFDLGIETYPVAFGVPNVAAGDALEDIADEGGHDLVTPDSKDELVEELLDIFDEIEVATRAFASASIPAIQSSAADKIFLSSFANLPGSVWAGRIDAFRKPLPLTADDQPDTDTKCEDVDTASGDRQSACHIWEAGEELCAQAPEAIDPNEADTRVEFQLGADLTTTRRVIYGKERAGARPNTLRLFDMVPIPANAGDSLDAVTDDLLEILDPDQVADWISLSLTPDDLKDFFYDVFVGIYQLKDIDPAIADDVDACDLDDNGTSDTYILGDVFHANPVSYASPAHFRFFANNTDGYRDFARQHAWRRKMVVAATNDGQLHFFDSGVRQFVLNDFTANDTTDRIEVFNDGSGHELFSYIPRFALPIVNHQVRDTDHIYSLDSTPTIADVYIDPTDDMTDDTQWRTVLVGGMREAGDVDGTSNDVENFKSGYYALDLTQPDVINPRVDTTDPTYVPCDGAQRGCNDTTLTFPTEWLPSCMDFTTDPDGDQNLSLTGCDFPFPMELWTFDDSIVVLGTRYHLDEDEDAMGNPIDDTDGNPIPDLAATWSQPVIGPIQVCSVQSGACDPDDEANDDDLELRHVAIFGGGMDAAREGQDEVGGNYLYMVDVETGEAIYKRELKPPTGYPQGGSGSAVGDPAVLDVNSDGLFDRIYIGTNDGLLYKVDLSKLNLGLVPGFETFALDEDDLLTLNASGTAVRYSGPAIAAADRQTSRILDSTWDPFPILDTGGPYEMTPRRGSPIYFAPAAFFIPELNQYGLAIGTGNRENLKDGDNGEDLGVGVDPRGGRFFILIDEDLDFVAGNYSDATACAQRLPITEECVKDFVFDEDLDQTTEALTDYLLDAPAWTLDIGNVGNRPGWAMSFTSNARIIAEAFIVAGILIFSAFDPADVPVGFDPCAVGGTTRAFVVSAKNTGPVAPLAPVGAGSSPLPPGERGIDRYHEIAEFTTAPFIDRTATKNPAAENKTILDEIDDDIADAVRNSLIKQYPRGSRFNKAFSLVIAALKNSTGVSVYTTIPIAVYPADWKDQ